MFGDKTAGPVPFEKRHNRILTWMAQSRLEDHASTARLIRQTEVGHKGGRATRVDMWFPTPEGETHAVLLLEPLTGYGVSPEFREALRLIRAYVEGVNPGVQFADMSRKADRKALRAS